MTVVSLGPLQSPEVNARFIPKVWVNEFTGCWIWRGFVMATGYGQFSAPHPETGETKVQVAHRVSYCSFHGPVPKGLDLDHLCSRRNCVNPAHLEPVTRKENLLRGDTGMARSAARTHCEEGHPLCGDNLYINPANNSRNCRACKSDFYKNWVEKNRDRRRELDRNHYHTVRKHNTKGGNDGHKGV